MSENVPETAVTVPDPALTPGQVAHDEQVPDVPVELPPETPEQADPLDTSQPVPGETPTPTGAAVVTEPVAPGAVVTPDPSAGPLDAQAAAEPGVATFAAAVEPPAATTEAQFMGATAAPVDVVDVPAAVADPTAPDTGNVSDVTPAPVASGTVSAPASGASNDDIFQLLTELRNDFAEVKTFVHQLGEQVSPIVEQVRTEGIGGLVKHLLGIGNGKG